MEPQAKQGTNWLDEELDVIVSDYFDMLAAELSGKSYIKARHSAALIERLGRSHRSVEFKHQNISAVLDKLGMPWIAGYKPKWNFQNAIFDAIDRYLSRNQPFDELTHVGGSIVPSEAIFVPPPSPATTTEQITKRLNQLIAKFDPVKRDF